MSDPLEDLITASLSRLSLRNDEDVVAFVKELTEEESFEPEDRKSAILGMLELDEDDEASSTAVDELLEEASTYQDGLIAKRRAVEEEERAKLQPTEEKKKVLTPEEEEKRKADLLAQYGRLEDETDAERAAREAEQPGGGKGFVDVTSLSKKQRKKALDGVDLLALPNLNKTHVQQKQQQQRAADSAKAQAKREKDKTDRKKQLDDAAKKHADKVKKAQKVERKA